MQQNGMQLSLLSALTRLGLDPWDEAARLSRLPRIAQARALAEVLGKLPSGDWEAAELDEVASNLVRKLPRPGSPTPTAARPTAVARPGLAWPVVTCGLVLMALWMAFGLS